MNGTNNSSITNVDYRLVGLSPQYWSHTPILIGDLVSLPLINGVDCLVTYSDNNESTTVSEGVQDDTNHKNRNIAEDTADVDHDDAMQIDPNNEETNTPHILPLSKVLLRGIATAIDRRPNGCTLIVLDDGSGSIDCRYWDNDDSSSGGSAFNLPALLAEHEPTNKQRRDNCRFIVGDMLEVMGKIKTLTAGSKANVDECRLSSSSVHSTDVPLEVRYGCIREVHASSVCLINKGETRMANQWNGEMVHWLKCTNFNKECNSTNKQVRVRSGKDILPLLGDAMSSLLEEEGGSCTILDKANGNNNVLQRKCCQTSQRFRSSFFYCHCEASLEAMDPNLQFRDALLNRLLDMEAKLQHISDSLFPSSAEDCLDLLGVDQTDTMSSPLLFTFESIYRDEEITTVATAIVSSTTAPEANAQRLIRKTFAAITNDGILSLYDHEQDLYLLVSRTRIIEPFLRSSGLGFGGFGVPQPFFIRSVPKKRISEIMNWIEEEEHEEDEGADNA